MSELIKRLKLAYQALRYGESAMTMAINLTNVNSNKIHVSPQNPKTYYFKDKDSFVWRMISFGSNNWRAEFLVWTGTEHLWMESKDKFEEVRKNLSPISEQMVQGTISSSYKNTLTLVPRKKKDPKVISLDEYRKKKK